MGKYKLSREQLENHLAEQLGFMKASANSFDAGSYGEGKRLAATARVLLHQTAASHSLLGQLGIRTSTMFVDTAYPNDPLNLLTHHGLVGLSIGDQGSRFLAMLDDRNRKLARFTDWWERDIVIDDRKGGTFTRRSLVLALSNKDGGAHVDPELDEAFAKLKLQNSMGWLGSTNDQSPKPVLEVELHSMRQIAHEILATLSPGYTKSLA